jgi:carbon-monoxide dehydrogenase medium subunit
MLAGGTDLLVQIRADRLQPDLIVDSKTIPELNEITFDSKSGLTIGAAVPCYRIYGDKDVQRDYPGLIDSTSLIGGTQIQGRATLGGNLCNAAPSADSIPVMIALGGVATSGGHMYRSW